MVTRLQHVFGKKMTKIGVKVFLTSYAKFELNSWTNHEITIKLPITDIFGYRDTAEVRMTSYLNNGYDTINCFAKF